jgi:nicotinate-nucleotide adenylyltransferase
MSTDKPLPAEAEVIAILGGTFDPIHNGHIETAQETAHWLGLNKLYLLPAHIPPHKTATSASALQREAMVNLVCQQYPLFELDNRELERHSSSYTLTSLQEIKQEHPNSIIFFIIGMDSLLTFTQWHQWQDILKLCHLVVNIRPGYQLQHLNTEIENLLENHQADSLTEAHQHNAGCIIFHDNQAIEISSSEIRNQINNQELMASVLPHSVIRYIAQQKLYQK